MRREPYTARGISRVPCVKKGCPRPSVHQWRICSTSAWTGVCLEHDIELNRMVATWAFGKRRGAKIIKRYEEKIA